MRKGLKLFTILALIACAGLATQGVYANCQGNDGTYPITQCGRSTWFGPTLPGTGTVSAVWWQLGFGNNGRSRGPSGDSSNDVANNGDGWIAGTGTCTVGTCVSNLCATGPHIGAVCTGTGNQLPCGECTGSDGSLGTNCILASQCTNLFIGNDSGLRTTDPNSIGANIDLVDAAFVGGPPTTLCFSSSSNWGSSGSDGCGDNSRTGTTQTVVPGTPGTCDTSDTCDTASSLCVVNSSTSCTADADCFVCSAGTVGAPCPGGANSECDSAAGVCGGVKNDDHLNKLYGPCAGLGTSTLEYQLDAPMGTLLTESNKKYFALAFFASNDRLGDASDRRAGDYLLDDIGKGATNRGDQNTAKAAGILDVIPWQRIPGPVTDPNFFASATLAADPNNALLTASWSRVRIVDDGSIRPSADGTLGGCTGVGARDCGTLVRYQLQRAPIVAGVCGAGLTCTAGDPALIGTACSIGSQCGNGCGGQNFVAATGVPATAFPVFNDPTNSQPAIAVARDSCVRLRTTFGKIPNTTLNNAANAAEGRLGDLLYVVDSGNLLIGKTLVSENAILKVAAKNKNALLIEFDSTSELNVRQFDIVGKDAKGERVIGKVDCVECSTGRGHHYSTLIPAGDVKGSKSVLIVTKPSGTRSNELPIQ